MKRLLLVALCLCFIPACGKGPAAPADVNQAGSALQTALDAWKSGKSQKDLAEQNPSIIMNEDDWRVGKRLIHFEIKDAGVLTGRQVVSKVQIQLEDKDGKKEDCNATYVIDTTPRIVIVRDLFASRRNK
jgi:hypothetical protein